MRGVWKGGNSYKIDSISKKKATEYTPVELQQEIIFGGVHTILHWIDRDNPNGPIPSNPQNDPQYEYWEYGVRNWFENWKKNNPGFVEAILADIPIDIDDIHTQANSPKVKINSPIPNTTFNQKSKVQIELLITGKYPIKKTELYLNDRYLSLSEQDPKILNFIPQNIGASQGKNTIRVIVYDNMLNTGEAVVDIIVQE